MKKVSLFLLLLLGLLACQEESNMVSRRIPIQVIPTPKSVEVGENAFLITDKSFSMATTDAELLPLLAVFKKELQSMSDFNPTIGTDGERSLLVFGLDNSYAKDAYQIEIRERIQITAGSSQAAAMARTTLLQMVLFEDGALLLPQVTIHDHPGAKYRGLMVDLARNWHSMGTIKKLIDLASYYKVNYVQLHFTDDQSYTLPSKKYPRLSTPGRHYSLEELNALEVYSQERGVTIIPEIDVPGHAKSLVTAYPELFGIAAYEQNPYIINMGKEEVYAALDTIFSEIIPIFKATPYFHIGGDEARFDEVMEDPEVKVYMKTNALGNNDVHELYRHFLVRTNDIIKKHGKQTCIWEGFGKEGHIEIPKDIIVFEFESLYHLPNDLIDRGYTVVNASWKPLYVVNEKKWEPKTIFDWNLWRFENWWSRSPATASPIQLEETSSIIGAQMCTWEQPQEIEFSSLRRRLPVMMERIWNTDKAITYEVFMERMDQTDQTLSVLTNDSVQDPVLIGHNHKEPAN